MKVATRFLLAFAAAATPSADAGELPPKAADHVVDAAGAHFNEELLARVVLTSAGPGLDRDWVIGLEGSDGAAAFVARHLVETRVANESFEGRPIVFFLTEDLTTVVVWERTVEARVLEFTAEGDRLKDAETGSTWEPMTGLAMAGSLAGRSRVRVPSTSAIWHAWKTQFPDSRVFGEPARP